MSYRDDPPLHVERVEHPSIAGCRLQNLGSGQQLLATVRSGALHLAETSVIGLSRTVGNERLCARTHRHGRRTQHLLDGITLKKRLLAQRRAA